MSRRQNFKNTPYRNATDARVKRHGDYGKSGFRNRVNNRAVTGSKTHLLAPKPVVGRHKKGLYDTPRKTRKQHYTHNSRVYGHAGPQKPGMAPAYNPNEWVAKTTIRETTENFDHYGGAAAITGSLQPSYDPYTWAARTTIRETTEENNHLGGHSGIRKKHIAYDPNDRARTTIRETTEDNNYIGGHSGIQKKHIAYDPKDRARTTIRETTEDNRHLGGHSGIRKKHVVYDPKDRARTTIRETTEDNRHLGGVSNGLLQSGKAYMTSTFEAKNTNRQFTSDNDYTGIANSSSKKTRSYTDAYNARTNENKEHVAKGRRPMGGGPRLGHQEINIEVKKMDEDRVNQYAAIKGSTVGNMYNPNAISAMTQTSQKNYLPQHDIRLDTDILEALKRNPLAQSLHSWA